MTRITHASSMADVVHVQPGWHVFSRRGEALGEVIAVDGKDILLRGVGPGAPRYLIQADALIEQEEAEMRARVSLDRDDLIPAADA